MNKYPKTALQVLAISTAINLSASAATLFLEDFQPATTTGDRPISEVGWVNDIAGSNTRLGFGANFAGKPSSDYSTWSYANAGISEAFYTTVANSAGFAPIDLSLITDLTFAVDNHSSYNGGNTTAFFALKLDSGNWYVSSTAIGAATGSWTTQSLIFNAAAANWNNLTIPTEGTDSIGTGATVGATAGADLSGIITGVGVVVTHAGGDGTHNIDNFLVTGTAVPEPGSLGLLSVAALAAAMTRRRKA